MAAAERFEEGPSVTPLLGVGPLQRTSGKLQSGDPAFRAGVQCGDIGRGQVQAHYVVEESGCLCRGETQVVGTQLDDLATRAPPAQRPGRVGPAGDDQVHMRRLILQQKGQRIVDLRIGDFVQVVEDENERLGDLDEFVDQAAEECLHGRRL